jgi:RNA polymerase sigma-70 factor (ECF subfamily)
MIMDSLSEAVRRVLAGDRDAYADIVREHQDMLLAYAAYRVPDGALVDEVVQQTFIRAYEQLGDYDPGKDFGNWLRAICRFMILAELKRATRDRANRLHYREVLRQQALDAALAAQLSAPDVDVGVRLRGCLGRLQDRSRALVHYRYEEGLKVEEIARRVGESASWVATTLFRVRDALRKCLEQGPRPSAADPRGAEEGA